MRKPGLRVFPEDGPPLRRFAASPQGDHALGPAEPDLRRVLGKTLRPSYLFFLALASVSDGSSKKCFL